MTILTIDVETTIKNKGNPFTKSNKLVVISLKRDYNPVEVYFYPDKKELIKEIIANAKEIVGFNQKFDLSWLEREGLYEPHTYSGTFWDCQLVHFLLSRQSEPYPSLDSACAVYNLGSKLSNISSDYWDKGIDTDQIPREELVAYAEQDINLTYNLYLQQRKAVPESMLKLVKLHNADMRVLQTMESNGMTLAKEEARLRNEEISLEIVNIEQEISSNFNIEVALNYSSPFHISALLYGGKIGFDKVIQVGFYKSGKRKGQPKAKRVTYYLDFPRLVEPLPQSALKTEGYWSTDSDTLSQLKLDKDTQHLVDLLHRRSELVKLSTTYLKKLTEMIDEMEWDYDLIHGRFNQCVAITGRLSSSKPNLQNFPSEMKKYIRSRYV